jgi:sulfonate transport system permease protein
VIIWFGIGEAPKIALVAVGTAFPVYLNTYAGIRNVDARLVGAIRSQLLRALGVATDPWPREDSDPRALRYLRESFGRARHVPGCRRIPFARQLGEPIATN